ncbi:MAG: hypothetical protein GTO63_24680 [Anaerolineae bacterium]|nr:hypothetical protein [Anaerolineae bacterium]NIN97923.1 hypothetical protein [Anaerolineae bacterium]NIQ80897.1 hypothetical protein [Anaerolineae bacterium]
MESHTNSRETPWETSLRYDAPVIALAALAFVGIVGLRSLVLGQRAVFTDPDARLSVQYPASWTPGVEKGSLLSVQDLRSKGAFKATFSIVVKELDSQRPIRPVQELVVPFTVERGRELRQYGVLDIAVTQVDTLDAARITYTYVDYPSGSPLQSALPVVVKAVDILVIHGDNLYILSFAAPAATFAQHSGTLDAILNSVDLDLSS